jgi:membrane protease YdiL (CAAX protease family)
MSVEKPTEGDPTDTPPSLRGPEASREPSPGRRRISLVRAAVVFYLLLLGAALLWAGLLGDSLLYLSPQAEVRGVRPLRDVGLGIVAGVLVILLSHQLTRRTRSGANLARSLGRLLGRLSLAECALLAAVSGVAEEAFFRGVLQPRIGLLAAALIFGLAHFVPRRELAPWALFAVAAGLLLGVLFESTGNLVAPVVAHASINAVNLRLLSNRYAGDGG